MSVVFTRRHQVTILNPSSPWGYERSHTALHAAGDHENAIKAFDAMLSQLPDRLVRGKDFDFAEFIY